MVDEALVFVRKATLTEFAPGEAHGNFTHGSGRLSFNLKVLV